MQDKELNDKEVAQRRDDALRRALNTPPKPHKLKPKKKKKEPKDDRKK